MTNEESVEYVDFDTDMAQAFHKVIAALEAQVEALQPWKAALEDAAVVNWCLSEENANDPRKMLADVVSTCIVMHDDPAISDVAAKRVQQVEELTREVNRLNVQEQYLRDGLAAWKRAAEEANAAGHLVAGEAAALREQLRLTHIDWQLEQSKAQLVDHLPGLLDCIVWMSGSGDFGPDAPAGKAWAEFRDKLVKPAMQEWADFKGEKPGPLLTAEASPAVDDCICDSYGATKDGCPVHDATAAEPAGEEGS